jgi:pimeloyl-ACP methyl ester carboxylesterase
VSTHTYEVSTSSGDVPVTVTERGQGAPVVLLHGGAGPDSVTGFADLLAARLPYRVITPIHPGFNGTERPGWLDSVRKLADVYRSLLEDLDLTGVTVAGNSIGGWIGAELALAADGRVARVVLIDAVGLDSADHPVADFYSMPPAEIADYSWANPEGHRIDLASMTEAQRNIFAGNRNAMLAYSGQSMSDPTLAGRLGGLTAPTLIIWGEADRMVTPAFGEEYAAAIPKASFHQLPNAGHLPQLETPEAVLALFAQS